MQIVCIPRPYRLPFAPFRLLIQTGMDINVRDNDGWTPLHAAAHWGKEEACHILVENLCDMHAVNKVVSRPLSVEGHQKEFVLGAHDVYKVGLPSKRTDFSILLEFMQTLNVIPHGCLCTFFWKNKTTTKVFD